MKIAEVPQQARLWELSTDLFRGRRKQCAFAIALSALLPVFSSFSVMLLIPILRGSEIVTKSTASGAVDTLLNQCFAVLNVQPSLNNALLMFLGFSCLHAGLAFYQLKLTSRLRLDFVLNKQEQLHTAVGRAHWSFFLKTRPQDIAHALSIEFERLTKGIKSLMTLISSLILATAYIGFSFYLSPMITAIIVLGGLAISPIMVRHVRSARSLGSEMTVLSRQFYRETVDHLAGAKEAKIFGAQKQHAKAFGSIAGLVSNTRLRFEVAKGAMHFAFVVAATIAVTATIFVAITMLKVAPVSLMLLLAIYSRLTPRVLRSQNDYQDVLHALSAYDSILNLQQQCQKLKEQTQEVGESKAFAQAPAIEFDDVGFRYECHSDVWAIRNITAKIPERSVTAIVGHSGSGKSTLADLLLGLLNPEAGAITVNGHQIEKHLGAWRNSVGYVPQETFLLHDTLKANLCWGNPDATDEKIWEALRVASLEDVILAMPDGLQTIVGERGTRLSGGERQRLALARAILRRPSVLILDEATSALDLKNAKRIEEALYTLAASMTIIVIAHQKSVVCNAQHMIVLDNGRIIEQGRPENLGSAQDLLVA